MENMDNEVVVIIDPQKDFTSIDGDYAKRHAGIAQILASKEQINKLLNAIDKDRCAVVFSDYREDQFEKGLSICIPGTDGHQIDINIDDSPLLIAKSSHSCFSSEAFVAYLKNNKINKLFICGFLAEYCVKQTAIDALKLGYYLSLIEDCIGTGDDVQFRKNEMLIELMNMGAQIIKSFPNKINDLIGKQ
jgi:nicotinamidase/pyrazinamidase